MLKLEDLRPFGYRVLVELLEMPERNPAGELYLPEQADKRFIAPRLAKVLKLPDGRGWACHCPSCQSVKETMYDRTQAPPDVDLRKADLGSIAEGDTVLLQTHGGTAVDLRGSGVDLSRHGLSESPVKAMLVLVHQILAVVTDAEDVLVEEEREPRVTKKQWTSVVNPPPGLDGLQDLKQAEEDEGGYPV